MAKTVDLFEQKVAQFCDNQCYNQICDNQRQKDQRNNRFRVRFRSSINEPL